ncbi:RCC1/BLIP-II protein [Coniochaeta ligniaria NRRL 30616]|uniref:RCC1/BLIP-II protein n=1 Tax=Coniochaeta ligniaria NRRL 30616 TaxID=1408157 RepID=A0A1J7IJD5_9PEZI|nr:RCC1/BLIP-II protein [Coniochaeta ligniaria NRRL 30616]
MGWTELHAAGFNAWSQVLFKPKSRRPEEPKDLAVFTRVLSSLTNDFRDVESHLSYTLVTTSSETLIAGTIPREQKELFSLPKRSSYRLIAEAANGKVTVLDCAGNLRMYDSARQFCENEKDCVVFPGYSEVIQLVAYEVGFAVLDRKGRVSTWGDERYPMCLGREATEASPANFPRLVRDLTDLPSGNILKIAAGGYVIAALTDGGDLYCWGGHAAQVPPIRRLDGTPNLVDIDEQEISDVAVGDSHLIVLTEDDKVLVIGNNSNGQLGIDAKRAWTWTQVELKLGEQSTVMAVRAGPKNSFLIVENDWEVDEDMSDTEEEAEMDEAEDKVPSATPKRSEDEEMRDV